MVNRALIICSTYTPLAAEFNEIRRIGLRNDYPLSFIDNIIGIKLSQYRRKMNGESKLTTERQCLRRLHEHGAPKTIYQQQQCNHVSDDLSVSNNIIELRRSSRIKNKTATVTTAPPPPTTDDDSNDNKIAKSSITRHEKETGHHMDWSNFQVTWQDNHYYRLLIKESLLIKTYEPELNKTTHSVPLLVFPDGLPRVLLPNPDL
ncbi:unnamed protein product [Rotaria sordida]|uniref:Helix-turn-helix domain-containing protein n=1 Tax=Rotaria sordida TaxID=392033 RepID=A0A815ETL8_9BILA|nr:unnamed protein product [Rotaria sordida]CAF1316473.1 unnamed protein product [Rotaria sordida]